MFDASDVSCALLQAPNRVQVLVDGAYRHENEALRTELENCKLELERLRRTVEEVLGAKAAAGRVLLRSESEVHLSRIASHRQSALLNGGIGIRLFFFVDFSVFKEMVMFPAASKSSAKCRSGHTFKRRRKKPSILRSIP